MVDRKMAGDMNVDDHLSLLYICGRSRMERRKRMYIYITIPALALMALFIAAPLVNAVRISFFKWNGYSQHMRFKGLENYADVFTDKLFWRSLGNTMIYGFGSTLLQNVAGLLSALFLNRHFQGRNAVRTILYMPIMISAFIMGEILYYFVALDGGVFNEIIGIFGIEPVYWMHSGLSSTIMIMLINSWQYMGLCMIIYLAGLQNIPSMYIEAAKLDGASKHQMFWHVTFPLLIPAVTTAVVTNLIGGFKLFDPIVPLSNGGPNRQSMSLAFYINLLYFNDEKAGVASALGIVTFLVIMAISIPVNKFLQSREVEY